MTQNAAIDLRRAPPEAKRPWAVLATLTLAEAHVELRRYDLPRPSAMWEMDDAPILSAVMPRAEGMRGEIRFDAADRHAHKSGRLLLRPAGIAMHSAGNGGVMDILTCRFDPAAFAALTGLIDWDARRLQHCVTLFSDELILLTERLRRETVAPGFGSTPAAEALVRLLMVEIGRLFHMPRPGDGTRGGLAPWQLVRIEERLNDADGHWPTTAELAALCGISRSHLSRTFLKTTGQSLADHAGAIRIDRAQRMMRADDRSMAEIAFALGFASPSAFGAAFRRATGRSPLRFAQMARAESGR